MEPTMVMGTSSRVTIRAMELDLKAFAITKVEDARNYYRQDLDALPDEAFDRSPGGVARTPAHFTYEIVCVNSRFTKRIRGEDPGPFSTDLWANTPDEFRSKAGGLDAFLKSMDEFIEALNAVPADEVLRQIEVPSGVTSPYDLALFCASHVNYHDGQLNYIQALNGDADVHWHD
jgi:hypothetical protein